MGVISTPNAGGIIGRRVFSSGSVGHDTTFRGNSLIFCDGYQLIITRHSIANARKLSVGSNIKVTGCTQESISEERARDGKSYRITSLEEVLLALTHKENPEEER